MASEAGLVVELKLTDDLSPALNRASQSVDQFAKSISLGGQNIKLTETQLRALAAQEGIVLRETEGATAAVERQSAAQREAAAATGAQAAATDQFASRLGSFVRQTLLFGTALTAFRGLQETLGQIIPNMMALGEATHRLSEITGLQTREASALIAVTKDYGVSAEQLTGILADLQKKQADAAAAGDPGAQRSALDLLLDVADAYQRTGDKVAAYQAAAASVGETQARELLPVLALGRQGLLDQMRAAEQLNRTLDPETVEAMRRTERAQRDLNAAMEGIGTTVAQTTLPTIAALAENLDVLTGALNRAVAGAVPGADAFKVLLTALVPLSTLLSNREAAIGLDVLTRAVVGLGKAWAGVAQSDLRLAAEGLDDVSKAAERARADFEDAAARRAAATPPPRGNEPPSFLPDPDKMRRAQQEYEDLLEKDAKAVEDHNRRIADSGRQFEGQTIQFNRRIYDLLTERARAQTDTLAREVEAVDRYNRDLSDRYKGITRDLEDSARQRQRTLEGAARQIGEVRTDLAEGGDEAERERSRRASDMDRQRVQAEADTGDRIAATRRDLGQRLAEIDRAGALNRADAEHAADNVRRDLGEKLADLEQRRVDARREADRRIEDAAREHRRRLEDIDRQLRELPTDFVTADTLRQRRELMERRRDAEREGRRAEEDARREAGTTLGDRTADIDRQAAAARREADQRLAEIARRSAAEAEASDHARELARREADERIADTERAAAVRAAESILQRARLDEDFAHDRDLSTRAADRRIADLDRTAKEREEDRTLKQSRDIADYNEAVTRSFDETNKKIADYERDRDTKIEAVDTATARAREDYRREGDEHAILVGRLNADFEAIAVADRNMLDKLLKDNGEWVLSLNGVQTAVEDLTRAYAELQRLTAITGDEAKLSRMTPEQLDDLTRQIDALTRQVRAGLR